MVGDRGMITAARIGALGGLEDPSGWVTALRAPAITKLAAEDGPLQMTLFDQQDLAEISHPDYRASGWPPAATRCWPPTGPAPAAIGVASRPAR